MTQEENVFIREFHCVDIQHILDSMILDPSILRGGLSMLSERKMVPKLNIQNLMPLI